jgi:hypothetical protein
LEQLGVAETFYKFRILNQRDEELFLFVGTVVEPKVCDLLKDVESQCQSWPHTLYLSLVLGRILSTEAIWRIDPNVFWDLG